MQTPNPFVRGGTQRRLEIASGVDEYSDELSEEGRSSSSATSRRGSQSSVPSTTSRSSSTVRFAADDQGQSGTPGRKSLGSRSRSSESLLALETGSKASFTNEEALAALAAKSSSSSTDSSSKGTKTKRSSLSKRSNKIAPEDSVERTTPPDGDGTNTPSIGSTTPKSTASSTSGDFSTSSTSTSSSTVGKENGNGKARKLWKEGIITVVAANRFKHGADHWRAMQNAVLGGNPSSLPVTPTTPGSSSVTSSSNSSGNESSSGGNSSSSNVGGGGGVRISSLKRSGSTTFNTSNTNNNSGDSNSVNSNNITPRPPLVRGGSSRRDLNVVSGNSNGGGGGGGGASITPIGILKKTPSGKDVSNMSTGGGSIGILKKTPSGKDLSNMSTGGGGGGISTPKSPSNEEIVRVAGLEKSAKAKKTAPLWRWAFGMVQEDIRIKRKLSKKEIDKRTRIFNDRRRSRVTYLQRPRSESYENPGEILPYLYVGGQVDAEDLPKLKSMGITHILNAAASLDSVHEDQFLYLRSDLDDDEDEDVVAAFDDAFAFIEDAKKNGGAVLVHCVAGMSRSVAIAVAWLVYGENVSLFNALNMVRGRRPVALPNVGFRLALAKFEVRTRGSSSVLDAKDDPAWNFEALRNFKVPRKPKAKEDSKKNGQQDSSCCCVL